MRWLVKIIAAIWPSSVEGLDLANAHLLAHIQHLREENDTLRSENEGLQGLIRQLQGQEDARTGRRSIPGAFGSFENTFTVPPVRSVYTSVPNTGWMWQDRSHITTGAQLRAQMDAQLRAQMDAQARVTPVRRITSPVAEVALATSRELRSRGAPRRPTTFTGPEAEDL